MVDNHIKLTLDSARKYLQVDILEQKKSSYNLVTYTESALEMHTSEYDI